MTRTWQHLEVRPPPGNDQINPAHTTIEFIARHLMIARVRGRFTGFSGQIHIDDEPSRSSVEVSIDADTIDTAEEDRDTHLRAPDFLHVERWPSITFPDGDPEDVEGRRWRVLGETARSCVLEGAGDRGDARSSGAGSGSLGPRGSCVLEGAGDCGDARSSGRSWESRTPRIVRVGGRR
ncbi:MAG TPA: YceI family protein [Nitriliruptorales bacterium]|nr:YceI family protein [Nitriliruptorales bacterium]